MQMTVGKYFAITHGTAVLAGVCVWLLWRFVLPADADVFTLVVYGAMGCVTIWSVGQLRYHTSKLKRNLPDTLLFLIAPPLIEYAHLLTTHPVNTHEFAAVGVAAAAFIIGLIISETLIIRAMPERCGIWDLSERI